MPVFGAAGEEVVIVCGGCEDRKERNVKKTVVTKKATAMIILGGRMMVEVSKIPQKTRSALQLQHAENESHPMPQDIRTRRRC
jgi:hypothetical protein